MAKNILTSVLFLCLCMHAVAITRHVPQQYPTIQSAINAAASGDTILVTAGVYYENISFTGKGIVLASQFLTTNDTSFISSTIIDGSNPVYPDTASCVRITSKIPSDYADSTAMLVGFTIRNGTGTRWEDEHNPGSWYREGGGLLIQYLSPRIRFNHFISNFATNKTNCTSAGGGAIRCGDGNPLITNNIMDHNQGLYGGGLVFNFSGATIKNNIICGNSGGQDFGGGGIWAYGTEAHGKPRIIENNTIVNNASVLSGGGIRVWSTPVTLVNNIIWGNTSSTGSQIYSTTGSAIVTYCDVQYGYSGNGNMNQIPQFESSNYLLSSTSPCADNGDPDVIYNDPADPANPGMALPPSRGTLRNDMGAYGGPGSALMGTISTIFTGTPDHGFNGNSIHRIKLTPNPCSEHMMLSFNLDTDMLITLELINPDGKISYCSEKTLFHRGENNVRIEVSRLSPGICAGRIISDNETVAAKFIKL